MSPPVAARALWRRHRGGRGVGPLGLRIEGGEVLCVMGPNGAGKTTLLRVLATIDRPGGGEVRWWGSRSRRAARRRLGVALDAAVEEPLWSGRQAATFWCRQWVGDRAGAARSVGAALERFGLAAVADEPVGDYSFGMRRRLALVQALAHRPALAVLDEPTAGLDPGGVGVLTELLAERARAGLAALVASNDAAFVERSADRIMLLRDGAELRTETPAALRARVSGTRVVEIETAHPVDAERVAQVAGVSRVRQAPDGLTVHAGPDCRLPEVVAAADRPPGALRALRVRAPDLADGFAELTGAPLVAPPERPASPERRR